MTTAGRVARIIRAAAAWLTTRSSPRRARARRSGRTPRVASYMTLIEACLAVWAGEELPDATASSIINPHAVPRPAPWLGGPVRSWRRLAERTFEVSCRACPQPPPTGRCSPARRGAAPSWPRSNSRVRRNSRSTRMRRLRGSS